MTDCPPRPTSERPQDLGFTRQPMTRWMAPGQLIATGLQVVLSGIFGEYADKRESQESRPCEPVDLSAGDDIWVDFVSDLGDGFNPTYAVACLLAEEKLDLAGAGGQSVPTERGRLLVMSGDEVYPAAHIDRYRNKMTGPYRAALPHTEPEHPLLVALPGNHDWYDGLTAFSRVFCQGNWIGGWQTTQRRSYFAVALPHRWWLWGIDIQFDTYIDEPQLEFFRDKAGALLQPGDSVLLCSAKPNWVDAYLGKPDAYGTLDFFQRTTIEPRQAVVRALLTGDSHHYARYQARAGGAELITAGGGGAFLSDTHHLPPAIELPPPLARAGKRAKAAGTYDLKTTYPTQKQSRRIAAGVFTLAAKNPSFAALVGAIYALYAWTVVAALRAPSQKLADVALPDTLGQAAAGILRSPVAMVLSVVLVLGLAGFSKAESRGRKAAVGSAHAAFQIGAVIAVLAGAGALLGGGSGLPLVVLFVALSGVVGGLAGSLVMAAYLYLVDRFLQLNANELFAAQRIEDWKNFLRLHIDHEGVLTIYPVKIDKVPKKWRLRRGGEQDDPWFEPDGPATAPVLLEEPIRITPASATPPPG
ncbi:MAG TPA: hypothetical protein VFJ85_00735 [Acidimicrobiales bacterium]|nr:hypothetical protein [Acidimicrobiales bacterium]